MSDLSDAARQTRISDLKRKLKARKGNPAFQRNCIEIETEIARLESLGS